MGTIREKLYVMYIIFLIMLIPGIGVAGQTINIVAYSTFSVAGNGSTNVGVNYGEIKIGGSYNYVSPSSYGGNNDSNNNIINVSSSVSVYSYIYGGVNYPFVNSPVAGDATDVAIIHNITANNNTVNINSRMNNDVNIYGGYSVLSGAIRNIVPSGNMLSSTITMSGNTVNVNAQCTVMIVYGAYLYLNPTTDESNAIRVRSPINMDNNSVNISSSVCAYMLSGAYVSLYNGYGAAFDIPSISVSGNSINISSDVSDNNVSNVNVYAARLMISNSNDYKPGSSNISTVTVANNTIILSKSDLSLPKVNLYGVHYEVPSDVVENYDVHDNALYINNAKNVGVKSIHGFDVYRF
ncbi:MAG: hypothetical protein LBU10_03625, partial [Endomicrobium sp.]|nr:hypothetical protein [Endomicrobium sp.]